MTRIPHAAYTLDTDAGHRQTRAPAGEEECAGQALQVAAAADEKVPARQSVQSVESVAPAVARAVSPG